LKKHLVFSAARPYHRAVNVLRRWAETGVKVVRANDFFCSRGLNYQKENGTSGFFLQMFVKNVVDERGKSGYDDSIGMKFCMDI